MPDKILFVNSCVRPESRTLILAERVLSGLDGDIEEVNLEKEKIMPMDGKTAALRDKAVCEDPEGSPLLCCARQFVSADVIVIAAPYWDLSFPAMLKAYMEAVTVCGVSFYYTPEGLPVGLCKARELIYVTTAGGSIGDPDYGFGYIKALSENFYGIGKVIRFYAENLDITGADVQNILQKTLDEIDEWKSGEGTLGS